MAMAEEKRARKVARSEEDVAAEPKKELSGKQYAKEMKKLHVELVKLQRWVVEKGLKVCVVFEGRDGAGKGGRSRRSPSGSAHAFSASWRSRRPASARRARCTSSATSRASFSSSRPKADDRQWRFRL
jgi:hypothetical protein